MPFVNLPDTHKSRWGDELTRRKNEGVRLASLGGRCTDWVLRVDRGTAFSSQQDYYSQFSGL